MGDINFFVSVLFLLLLCFKYTSVIIAVSNNMIFYHEVKKLETFLFSLENNSELKPTTTTATTTTSKKKRFNDQNDSSARVHHDFKYISLMSTTRLRSETSYTFDALWRTWTYDDELSFPFSNLNKILKNSYPGKFTCIWHIEWVQIDTIMFERTKIHFLSTFSLPSSSSLLKVPNVITNHVKLK